jgi:hypothetical protein
VTRLTSRLIITLFASPSLLKRNEHGPPPRQLGSKNAQGNQKIILLSPMLTRARPRMPSKTLEPRTRNTPGAALTNPRSGLAPSRVLRPSTQVQQGSQCQCKARRIMDDGSRADDRSLAAVGTATPQPRCCLFSTLLPGPPHKAAWGMQHDRAARNYAVLSPAGPPTSSILAGTSRARSRSRHPPSHLRVAREGGGAMYTEPRDSRSRRLRVPCIPLSAMIHVCTCDIR